MKYFPYCAVTTAICAVTAAALLLNRASPDAPNAEITRVRLEPWTSPSGRRVQMAYVDWKNTGTTPIRVLRCDIYGYSDKGTRTDKAIYYTIYANSMGIAPGQSYVEPAGKGFAIVELPKTPTTVHVEAKLQNARELLSVE